VRVYLYLLAGWACATAGIAGRSLRAWLGSLGLLLVLHAAVDFYAMSRKGAGPR
jgi:hypothetical protein